MSKSTPFPAAVAKSILPAALVLMLTGCTTGKSIHDASDISDDGKSNTMLISYDISLNVTEKYPTVSSTTLVVRCGEPNRLGVVPECFEVKLPLQGKRDVNDYTYFTFKDSGAKAVQMPYGAYALKSIENNVVVGVENRIHCQTLRQHRHRRRAICHDFPIDVTQRYWVEIPELAAVDITPGAGCYAGHLSLETNDGAITSYSFDQTAAQPNDEVIAALPENIQDTVQSSITRSCVAG